MPVKKLVVKKQKTISKKKINLSVPIYSLAGNVAGKLDLPREIFGAEVNQVLLAQALRVYLNNQKSHWASTKTRGEVEGSTRKIFKQKGTGRARHGAIRAPIFVGGGIALGPKYRKIVLDLPKKMKKKALLSALSLKAKEGQIYGVSGLDKASGKTKELIYFVEKLAKKTASKKEKILIITGDKLEQAKRATRNIPGVDLKLAKEINALEVIKHQKLLLTKDALAVLTGEKNA